MALPRCFSFLLKSHRGSEFFDSFLFLSLQESSCSILCSNQLKPTRFQTMIAPRCLTKSVRQTSFLGRFLIITYHSSAGWNPYTATCPFPLAPSLTRPLLFKRKRFTGLCLFIYKSLFYITPTIVKHAFCFAGWRRDPCNFFPLAPKNPKRIVFPDVWFIILMGTQTS